MRPAPRWVLGLAAVTLVLVGCGGGEPAPTPSATTTTPPTTPSPSPTSSAPTPTAAPTPTRTPTVTPSTPAAWTVPAALRGLDVRVIPTQRRVMALTFDGGANDAGLARILAVLDAQDVRATFFLTGRFATAYPEGSRAIAADGHVIGNHTMTHPHPTRISDAELAAEVREAQTVIRRTTGRSPLPWFRFPFGERTAADIRLLNDLGYVCVSWTVDTLGWLGTEAGSASDVTDRVLAELQPGEIVLMHIGSNPDDGTTFDADALAATIRAVRARGYTFTTVEALLG